MSLILENVKQALRKYHNRPMVIAYSGGVDSQVLLHAISLLKQQNELSGKIKAIHVNHGLSDNANDWQNFALKQCVNFSIECQIQAVIVEDEAQLSLEAQARDARYQALAQNSASNALILTGHHQDDQAETFLLALKRGSGLKGLSAMGEQLTFADKQQLLIRPLLNISRNEIVNYAKANHLDWVEDESNNDINFDRNFLRRDILPLLKQRWPSIEQTISRSAHHCAEGQILLDEMAQQDLQQCQINEQELSLSFLLSLSSARFNNVFRYFLHQHQVLMPSQSQLNEIKCQLQANNDKSPTVQLGEHCLRRYQNSLFLTEVYSDVSPFHQIVNIEPNQLINVPLPDAIGSIQVSKATIQNQQLKKLVRWQGVLAAPKTNEQLSIRFEHSNPTVTPDYRKHSRPLKKVLQELKIAPWLRKRLPLIYYNETLVAVAGYFVCKEFIGETSPEQGNSLLEIYWLDN